MTLEALLQEVMGTDIDETKKDALAARLMAADERFERRSHEKMVTEEFLSYAYSL